MDTEPEFTVLINAEQQYSLWPAARDLPEGWSKAGYTGSKDDCVAYVDENWTDPKAQNTDA